MKKYLSCLIALCLFFSAGTAERVQAHWAEAYIEILAENGVLDLEQETRPEDLMLRGEFAALVNRVFGFTEFSPADSIADVPPEAWYYKELLIAKQSGYMKGNENGDFSGDQPLTRQEAAVMLNQAAGGGTSGSLEGLFHDWDAVADWAADAVYSLSQRGIFQGYEDNTFRPEEHLLRGECFALLAKLIPGGFSGGDGTAENPYRITRPEQLGRIRLDLNAAYRIENDLDFLDGRIAFQAIGSMEQPFTGQLDGGGFRLVGLKTSESAQNALFDKIGKEGRVTGVRLVCPDTPFTIATENDGLIENCSNTSFLNNEIRSGLVRGGIAEINRGDILGCYNASMIKGKENEPFLGGIAGQNRGWIKYCFNTGDSTQPNAGGIAGENTGIIQECFNVGKLTGDRAQQIAGGPVMRIERCSYVDPTAHSAGQLATMEELKMRFVGAPWKTEDTIAFPQIAALPYWENEDFVRFYGGNGTKDNPYRVKDSVHFNNIRYELDQSFLQVGHINLSDAQVLQQSGNETGFEPIGNNDDGLRGVYDGNGYTISRLIMTQGTRNNMALFVRNDGEIRGVTLTDSFIEGGYNVGAIVSINAGKMINCGTNAKVISKSGGGIAAVNYGKNSVIQQCYNRGQILADKSAAGIVLNNEGKVQDCFNTGEVAGDAAGGISSFNAGIIERCYERGSYRGEKSGALVCNNQGILTGCYYQEQLAPVNTNSGQIAEVNGRSEVQYVYSNAFSAMDFETVWQISEGIGPTLKDNQYAPVGTIQNTQQFAGGAGTLADPYRIVTPMHLNHMRLYPDSSYELMNDLDLTGMTAAGGLFGNEGKGWEPLDVFSGLFNGNGYTIKGMKINRDQGAAWIHENQGIILNLNLVDFSIHGESAAAVAVKNTGIIQQCKTIGTIEGTLAAGGITVENQGVILSSAAGGSAYAQGCAGGITAFNQGTIADTFRLGEVIGQNEKSVIAGIAADMGGKIRSSYQAAALYFENGEGSKYPISNGKYDTSYYLIDDNEVQAGGKSYSQMKQQNQFTGFEFHNLWKMGDSGYPVLMDMDLSGLAFPHFFAGGDGSEQSPYRVKTLADLDALRMEPDAYYILTKNVDGQEGPGKRPFVPIGTKERPFRGTLLGDGFSISNLQILKQDAEQVGLFGVLDGRVENMAVIHCRIEGKNDVGAIAGVNNGTVRNVRIESGSIGAQFSRAGGIVGTNGKEGIVEASFSRADVFASADTGGICGLNQGVVIQNQNWGGVVTTSVSGEAAAGGIVGKNQNIVTQCINGGKIFSYSDSGMVMSGGIAGANELLLSDSYNIGSLMGKSGAQAYVGGIVGYGRNKMQVDNVYNTGYSNGSAPEFYQGSLVGGGEDGNISNSYYENTLTGPIGNKNVYMRNVMALSDSSMTLKNSYKGFDFKNVWSIGQDKQYRYPTLQKVSVQTPEPEENWRDFAGGAGTVDNPYRIMTAEQLNNVRKYLGATYALIGDIDLSDFCSQQGFRPIGDNLFSFFGTFMGNDYQIKGLSVDNGALFRENHGEIYNLRFSESAFSGEVAGMVASYNTGLIYQCSSGNQIAIENAENMFAGGLVGVNKSTGMIISSFHSGEMELQGESVQVGGIAYANYGVIAGCFQSGLVKGTGEKVSIAGGISAYNKGQISDCYNAGEITAAGQADSISGGIAGTSGGNLVNCYNSAQNMEGKNRGGIVGNGQSGTTRNCYYNSAIGSGVHIGVDDGIYGKTAEELKEKATYHDFDFENMWIMDSSFRYPYPQFIEVIHQ